MAAVSVNSGPGSLTTIRRSIDPEPDSFTVSTLPRSGVARCNGPSSGRWNTRDTCCSLCAISLPVRSRNGTPRQRSVSIHNRAATNVSVVESSAIPSVSV